jgi:NDP-sugar pyrophosphorylase family protein
MKLRGSKARGCPAGTGRRDAIYHVFANRVLSFGRDAIYRVSTGLCGQTKNCPAKKQNYRAASVGIPAAFAGVPAAFAGVPDGALITFRFILLCMNLKFSSIFAKYFMNNWLNSNMENYRNILTSEIEELQKNGCICDDWTKVKVKEDFMTEHVRNVSFSGEIYLGVFRRKITFPGGIVRYSGIYHAVIHNCVIEDDVYINQIKNYIANYIIRKNVIIESVDTLVVDKESCFGNGVCVAVLNETGGREIPIYNELSAHTAYLIAFYRHKPKMISELRLMIDEYTRNVCSDMGVIGEGAHIYSSRNITNINIGPYASIEGVYRLKNGSINSSEKDPSYIGTGVIAENFITASGCTICESSVVNNCFVGQGTVLGKQYSAENSVFFANCQGFHGEACSIFAGPYTASHHKSTLLIAAYYSFLNAGSGSNQSNHMYKLGPIHQGIIERGSKTASDSYILWPAKIGAFSLVMGRHYRNIDTSDIPFSYLVENSNESFLAPGVNLRSIGTIRDAQKWPKRDRRKDDYLLDCIIFNLLSPYSVQKIIKGVNILENLKKISGQASDHYMYNSARMTSRALEKGLHLYQIGITKFLGSSLVGRLESAEYSNEEEMRKLIAPSGNEGTGEWIDMAGLPAPAGKVAELIDDIENKRIGSLRKLNDIYHEWKDSYLQWSWNWIVSRLKTEAGIAVENVSAKQLADFVEKWKEAVVTLDNLIYEDAKKEFTLKSQTGFGIDGEDKTRISDFENVRGEFTGHPAVREIIEHIERKSKLADKVIGKLNSI